MWIEILDTSASLSHALFLHFFDIFWARTSRWQPWVPMFSCCLLTGENGTDFFFFFPTSGFSEGRPQANEKHRVQVCLSGPWRVANTFFSRISA